ncbi:MAG: hypothetical protein Q9209_004988 [Squamulea sp. 1 TL-2023]
MTVPRKRSPAFQGARLAFSSPPPTSLVSKPPSNTHSASHSALAAATSAGRYDRRALGPDDTPPSRLVERRTFARSPQEHDNAHPSYIAANRAARISTEFLLAPTSSPLLPNQTRPSPLRSHSDLSGIANTDGPSINALIKRYETEDSQATDARQLKHLSSKTPASLKKSEVRSASHPMRPTPTFRPSDSLQSSTPTRSPSSSTDSFYTSVADEPTTQRRQPHIPDSHTILRPKPLTRPLETFDRRENNRTIYNGRQIEPTLSNSTIPQLSVDSLADAMVASSLASSRAPSPTKPPLPPPRRRSRPHLFARAHSAEESGSRTPSPSKGHLRQTMRAPLDPNEELAVGKHKGKRFINKHPNKHHEGDRKRWRDQITEFERKRYEGVWAANRGLLTSTYRDLNRISHPPIDLANSVLNIVVRDIWRRSNLPSDVLGGVWELVDSRGLGLLGREEFVVGMWLVDQSLKGRKLPVKVSDSVWFSARGLTGVKVKRKH